MVATYIIAPSLRLSARALRSELSTSKTPQVACKTESKRQSPAVRFHKAYKRLLNLSVNSKLQFIIDSSTSNSGKKKNIKIYLFFYMFMTTCFHFQ